MRRDRPSRTAVLVCQGRAVADKRLLQDRFSDPIPARFLTEAELARVLDVPVEVGLLGVPVGPVGWLMVGRLRRAR